MASDIRKTSGVTALGVFFMLWVWALPVLAHCPASATAERETARVGQVIDGDTVRLDDGRRVRFLGVNAPELGRAGAAHEALAVAARVRVAERIPPGHLVTLVYDVRKQDRFGRVLAYIYDAKGRSLEAQLLREGLAFQTAVPPNLALADCLRTQQGVARERSLGVWRHSDWQPTPAAQVQQGGFQLVQGRVTDVSRTRGAVWLELDGPVVLQVATADWSFFHDENWHAWLGRDLLVSGWVIDRSGSRAVERGFKPWMIRLRSPHAVLEITPRSMAH